MSYIIIMYIVVKYRAMEKVVYIIVNDRSTITCLMVLEKVTPTICTVVHVNSN